MKYNELDIKQFINDSLINTTNKVEYRNKINEFFINGFESYYKTIQNYALSTASPLSLYALNLCTDTELNILLNELGVSAYSNVSRDAKIHFIYALSTIPYGTDQIVDAIVKFAFDTNNLYTEIISSGNHLFDIIVNGDITNTSIQNGINRIIANLNRYNVVYEKLNALSLTHEHTDDSTYIGNYISACNNVELTCNQISIGTNFYTDKSPLEIYTDYFYATGFQNGGQDGLYNPTYMSPRKSTLLIHTDKLRVPNNDFSEVYIISNNGTVIDVSKDDNLVFKFSTAKLSNTNPGVFEINPSDTNLLPGDNSALVIKFTSKYNNIIYDRNILPSDLYNIDDNKHLVTWNTEHCLYNVLKGHIAYISEISEI